MEIIKEKDSQIVFSAEIEESLANAIRRYLHQIPIIAIDEVEISKNDSPLYDEIIAHQMGLIPLKMDKTINEKTSPKLKLSQKGEGMVYSGELKGSVKVVYDKIPITFLEKGQELEIVALIKPGKGDEHSKFSPGLMFYRNLSEIIMDKEFLREIKQICPANEIKEKGDKIIILDNLQKEVCDVCEGICEKYNKNVEIKPTKELVITLESFGQLNVKEIFKKSVEILKKDLLEVSKKISK